MKFSYELSVSQEIKLFLHWSWPHNRGQPYRSNTFPANRGNIKIYVLVLLQQKSIASCSDRKRIITWDNSNEGLNLKVNMTQLWKHIILDWEITTDWDCLSKSSTTGGPFTFFSQCLAFKFFLHLGGGEGRPDA
uniref:Uncharacterized protein n=1 Tax=Opuntia streptacantha TaxID=393608 RepID=A0A7C8YBL2_OPUST